MAESADRTGPGPPAAEGAPPGQRLQRALDYIPFWRWSSGRPGAAVADPPAIPLGPDVEQEQQRALDDGEQYREVATGGNRHGRRAQSTASRTTTSTVPVLVRTYSGSKSRRPSRAPSTAAVGEQSDQQPSSSATTTGGDDAAGAASTITKKAKLPAVNDFKFSQLLLTVEPDINSAIDAIAEICARSRLSLADEYAAHLPPFTHSMPSMPRTRGQVYAQRNLAQQLGRGARGGDGSNPTPLTTVPETSSSSEHSSPSTTSGSGSSRGSSAYGSLTKVLRRSGTPRGRRRLIPVEAATKHHREEVQRTTLPTLAFGGQDGPPQARLVGGAGAKVSSDIHATVVITTHISARGGAGAVSEAQSQRDGRKDTAAQNWFAWRSPDTSRDAETQLKSLLGAPAPG